MAEKISLEDLARHLNLAVATVSRALNGNQRVSEQTRARVAAVAEELGYRPSALARGLRLGKTGLVGICFYMNSPARNVIISQQLYFLQKLLMEHGKRTLVEFSAYDTADKLRAIEHFHSLRAEGIIHVGSFYPELLAYLERWRERGVPYVLLSPGQQDLPFSVTLDRIAIYEKMTDYLLDLGHRRIITLGMAPENPSYGGRLAGVRRALERRGLAFESVVTACFITPHRLESSGALGHRLAERFLPELRGATACFASNDDVAIGAIRYLRKQGVRVPEDLSIIGFDDSATAPFSDPSITTATQEVERMAHDAVTLLQSALHSGPERLLPAVTVVPTFIIRESTGPVPAGERPIPR